MESEARVKVGTKMWKVMSERKNVAAFQHFIVQNISFSLLQRANRSLADFVKVRRFPAYVPTACMYHIICWTVHVHYWRFCTFVVFVQFHGSWC